MSSFVGQAIKRACEEVAKELLAEIKDMMMRACDERSPGVILNWFYLDSKHLKKLDEDPAMYSMADVEMKVKKKAFDHVLFSVRPENGQNSPVCDLYILTEEEVFWINTSIVIKSLSRSEILIKRKSHHVVALVRERKTFLHG